MSDLEKNLWAEGNNGSNAGAADTPDANFLGLFSSQSLMSHNNNIAEFDSIKDAVEDVLKIHRSKSSSDVVKQSIPKLSVMSTDQSPNLPGIILHVKYGNIVYAMPVLFFKKGVVDMLDDYQGTALGNQPTFSKFAESFMTRQLRESVKSAFSILDGKKVGKVYLVSNYVVDVGNYLGSAKEVEIAIKNIANAVLNEWYSGIINFSLETVAAQNKSLTANPFRNNAATMFGKDNTALARIDVPEYPLFIAGKVEPYNLMVKLISAPKGDGHHGNLNQAKSVATTYLKIDLELMSSDVFRREYSGSRDRITRGPLIPVISIGKTVPGQQLQYNDSILCDIIGIYNALTVNNPISFSEGFRSRQVGSRGSLANLAAATYRVAGDDIPATEMLTSKSMLNQKEVQRFMESYISQRAVFVKDLATFVESPSNAELWWNAVANKEEGGRVYKRALSMALDKVSGGRLKDYVEANKDNKDIWRPGDIVMTQSTHIIPVGTAVRDNQIFNLEEIGQMMLHDPLCYGDNEQAVGQFMGLLTGSCGKEPRVRQHEIKRCLEELFGATLNIVGFKSRWVYDDKFLNAVVDLVGGSVNMQVTSSYGTRSWENQPSNDYLNRTSTAIVRSSGSVGGAAMTANSSW